MSWTEEKVESLKKLWGSGKTASQIAEIIGGISRNAVIGKAHRLNLSAKIKTRTATSNQNFDNSISEKNTQISHHPRNPSVQFQCILRTTKCSIGRYLRRTGCPLPLQRRLK